MPENRFTVEREQVAGQPPYLFWKTLLRQTVYCMNGIFCTVNIFMERPTILEEIPLRMNLFRGFKWVDDCLEYD